MYTECPLVEYDKNNGESRMCIESGYNTSELYRFDSPHIEKFEENTTQLICESKYKDEELGQYWYLTTIVFQTGILYPEGTPEDIVWVYSPVVTIDEEDRQKYPIPGKDGEFYQTRIAVEASERYTEFQAACKRMGAIAEGK